MDNNKVYFQELECWKSATEKQKNTNYKQNYFDLGSIPSDTMKQEIREFLLERSKSISFLTLLRDIPVYRVLLDFLDSQKIHTDSFRDREQEKWMRQFKGWLMQKRIPITFKKKNAYGNTTIISCKQIQYFRAIFTYLEMNAEVDELEKDIWQLDKLDIDIRKNPIYNVQTINFHGISQVDMKSELKKVIYLHLKQESLGTVQREMTVGRKLSKYLKDKYPEIQSFFDINREVLEEYLIHKMTKSASYKSNSDDGYKLRAIIETVGKLYGWPELESLMKSSDIPPELTPEFKVYSDEEMKRLNAEIIELDEQIARCMITHQMLGTRISDTLTLRTDCLYIQNHQNMITIHQVKTSTYQKPISEELAMLIQKSIEYTKEKYGDTEYIFVDDANPEKPLQYTTIKHKVLAMIQKKNLLDDHGKQFRFGTHLFRHYYGVKLTEMHLDDWALARLLGHKRLHSVKHYRKMSNQSMADETRKVREMMSEIILANLEGWGKEYEQIR